MIIETDHNNHQYIIRYKHLERCVDYKFLTEKLLEILKNEMIEEYRDIQIKKILNNEGEDTK